MDINASFDEQNKTASTPFHFSEFIHLPIQFSIELDHQKINNIVKYVMI